MNLSIKTERVETTILSQDQECTCHIHSFKETQNIQSTDLISAVTHFQPW